MTCKDCIGYEFCSIGRDEGTVFYGKDIACNDVEDLCRCFKNKADFVEVKHGYWIECGDLAPIDARCKCSLCSGYDSNYYSFCHNCGAKMDGIAVKEESF